METGSLSLLPYVQDGKADPGQGASASSAFNEADPMLGLTGQTAGDAFASGNDSFSLDDSADLDDSRDIGSDFSISLLLEDSGPGSEFSQPLGGDFAKAHDQDQNTFQDSGGLNRSTFPANEKAFPGAAGSDQHIHDFLLGSPAADNDAAPDHTLNSKVSKPRKKRSKTTTKKKGKAKPKSSSKTRRKPKRGTSLNTTMGTKQRPKASAKGKVNKKPAKQPRKSASGARSRQTGKENKKRKLNSASSKALPKKQKSNRVGTCNLGRRNGKLIIKRYPTGNDKTKFFTKEQQWLVESTMKEWARDYRAGRKESSIPQANPDPKDPTRMLYYNDFGDSSKKPRSFREWASYDTNMEWRAVYGKKKQEAEVPGEEDQGAASASKSSVASTARRLHVDSATATPPSAIESEAAAVQMDISNASGSAPNRGSASSDADQGPGFGLCASSACDSGSPDSAMILPLTPKSRHKPEANISTRPSHPKSVCCVRLIEQCKLLKRQLCEKTAEAELLKKHISNLAGQKPRYHFVARSPRLGDLYKRLPLS